MRQQGDNSHLCSLCRRAVPPEMITLHHLTPKERGGRLGDRVPMCLPCHKQVHALFANKELERRYSELPSLRRAPELQKFVNWIRKQPPTVNIVTHKSKTHPRRGKRY